jgi:uncharacterized DUF497 family protein
MSVNIAWDEKKSQQLQKRRGLSFQQVSRIFEGITVERVKKDDPRQFIAIGFIGTELVTVVYEEREDEEGPYLWLVTYWKSTNRERQIYEEETQNYFHRSDRERDG